MNVLGSLRFKGEEVHFAPAFVGRGQARLDGNIARTHGRNDIQDTSFDIVIEFKLQRVGGGINIGYPISETSRLSFGLTVQQDDLDTGRYTVDEIFDFMEEEGDSFLNFKASAGWSESTLNRGVLATRGHSQSLVFESTIPGSDLSFYKLDYNGQLFVPMSKDYTLRMHTRLGYGDAYGSTSPLTSVAAVSVR